MANRELDFGDFSRNNLFNFLFEIFINVYTPYHQPIIFDF